MDQSEEKTQTDDAAVAAVEKSSDSLDAETQAEIAAAMGILGSAAIVFAKDVALNGLKKMLVSSRHKQSLVGSDVVEPSKSASRVSERDTSAEHSEQSIATQNVAGTQEEVQGNGNEVVGVDIDRDLRREKITRRLKQRLDEGMVDEVRKLLDEGIAPEDLIYYGLEYKFLTLYVTGEITYDEMFHGLETAIHQFAKRQMTWFRGMERRGITIHWIDATLPMEEKVAKIMDLMKV